MLAIKTLWKEPYVLAIETAKCIPITLYGETKRNYQRNVGYETQKMNEQHSI